MPHSLQKAHLLKLRAGVGQALQCVRQVVVCCKVEAICMKHTVDHRQDRLVVLHLKKIKKKDKSGTRFKYFRSLVV